MFADRTKLTLGGVTVNVKRLTLGEIREDRELLQGGDFAALDERRTKMLAEHVTLEDGSPLKPEDLSLAQMRQLVKELVGLPEIGGISDFIGLLC